LRTAALAAAALAALTVAGCGREEPSINSPVSPPDTGLHLLAVYSMSIGEPSGLAYCEATHSLYMVSDANPFIYKIDTAGNVLASIPVTASDLEGITLNGAGDTIVVVEETPSLVTTFLANGTKVSSFPLRVFTQANHSLEGITFGPSGHLFILNEMAPTLMLEMAGSTEVWRKTLTYTTDISDICYDRTTDCFWIVSDQSKKILKLSRAGDLIREWTTTINQGEGIAFIGNRMYICSDVDAKLYVYVKPQ
jgi:uncharacterized protein YjiK